MCYVTVLSVCCSCILDKLDVVVDDVDDDDNDDYDDDDRGANKFPPRPGVRTRPLLSPVGSISLLDPTKF